MNPIAGMGGRIGLKGSDSPEIVERARASGISPTSGTRAARALTEVREKVGAEIEILTASGEMGADEARASGFTPRVVWENRRSATDYRDTEGAASRMERLGVDLLLFAGGDGTARNICNAIGTRVPSLGIPSGVKMHSGVFATRPRDVGRIVAGHFRGVLPLREREVMDIDEDLFRNGVVAARLFGYLTVPLDVDVVQGTKVGGTSGDPAETDGIAADVVERICADGDSLYVVGPGSTTSKVMEKLGLPCTLLGVDVVRGRELILRDASECQLLTLLGERPGKIVVSPIGGQGYVFGRGNQQISPRVIKLVGRDNILVVATLEKIGSLANACLLVDTGDEEVDEALSGSIRVITGYHKEHVCKVRGRL